MSITAPSLVSIPPRAVASTDHATLTREERSRRTRAALLAAHTTDCPQTRERLLNEVVLLNTRIADAVAARYRGRGVAQDDLRQAAYEGLVKAVHRFDPALRHDLLTYAVPTVRGELQRYFRDRSWIVRPPRRVQELQVQVTSQVDHLTHELGRTPRAAEVRESLGLDVADYADAVRSYGCFHPTSLDQPVTATGSACLGDLVADDDDRAHAAAEARAVLGPALRTLSPRDRRVLHLWYVDELTQREIGELLGVSQMQVSRLVARILRDLRTAVGVREPTPPASS